MSCMGGKPSGKSSGIIYLNSSSKGCIVAGTSTIGDSTPFTIRT